jgi:putative spermidine/putrescine transport system substrate-binding protein
MGSFTKKTKRSRRLASPATWGVSGWLPMTAATLCVALAGCAVIAADGYAGVDWSTAGSAQGGGGMTALVAAAKREGTLDVIGMPGFWANYATEFSTFTKKYGIKVVQTNPQASDSAEIEAVEHDKGRADAPDVVNVGQSFTTPTISKLFAPYEVQNWSDIPVGDKSPSGDWYFGYYGYIAVGCDTTVVPAGQCPTAWDQLTQSQFKDDVSLTAAPGVSGDSTAAVWDAALNFGGSLTNVQPGISFFKTLQSDGNLNDVACTAEAILANQCPLLLSWDFLDSPTSLRASGLPPNFLSNWQTSDLSGTGIVGYYAQAIAADAPHPAAARLWEEFLYSTQGQNIFLGGDARPIELAAMLKAGTENKQAYAALPKPPAKTESPTLAQATAAGTAIATSLGSA